MNIRIKPGQTMPAGRPLPFDNRYRLSDGTKAVAKPRAVVVIKCAVDGMLVPPTRRSPGAVCGDSKPGGNCGSNEPCEHQRQAVAKADDSMRTCLGCNARHPFNEDGTPVGGALPCGH